MDQQRDYNSSWSNDSSAPPPPNHDSGHFNKGGGFSNGGNYNHHRRYQNQDRDVSIESTDSFGHANGTAFSGRKRQFSHGPPEYFDGGNCAKLYVSNISRDATEEEIYSLFGKYGDITEVILFKQIKNLQLQGKTDGCFVKYANFEDADQAIKALDNQYTFPGRMRPIEVRHASKKQERPGPGCLKTRENNTFVGSSETLENKVFVCFLNRHASKTEIAAIFSPYGFVENVYIMIDDQRWSRGMGFVTFSDKAMAAAAINGLNGKYVMEGCDQPLVVRFAEPKKPKFGENRFSAHNSENEATHTDTVDPFDCDWSEQICPDGNAYYYNCVTFESLWEKPEEYSLYERQLENWDRQSSSPWQQHTW